MPAAPPRIVVMSALPTVAEEARRLAHGIGVDVSAVEPGAGGWRGAALLLLGEDVEEAPEAPGCSRVLVAVTDAEPGAAVWEHAANLGVEHVAVLPQGAEWLVQRMIAAVEPPAESAVTVGIVAGVGGAGASVLASAVARRAAECEISTALIDADPLGGGVDLVLGMESAPGLRWPALTGSRGRLRPTTLTEALPRRGSLTVLSWDRKGPTELRAELFDTVMAAAQQAFDFLVVDLPRHADADWTKRCHHLLVVTPAQVRAAVATSQVAARLTASHPDVRLVVRRPLRGGLEAGSLAESLGLPLAGVVREDRGLSDTVDRGEGLPNGRSRVAGLAAEIVDEVLPL